MREELHKRLEKEYRECCENATNGCSLYERFAKEEIACSFAANTTVSNEKIAKLLEYKECLLDYLYSLFYDGEDAFAIAVQEKLDQSLLDVEPIRAF